MTALHRPLARTHALILVLAPLLAGGCSRSASPPTDALLLTIDTLRGDRWGCLGDPLAHTPHLDRLTRGGTLAFEGRAPAPITLPSHTSMMTGLPPAVHGVRDNGIFRLDAEAGTTLAERLRDSGWTTAAFVSAFPLLSGFGLDRGFEHYDSALGSRADDLGGMRQRTATQTLDRLERWLAGAKGAPPSDAAPLFLWVHLFDPHADYEAPAPWAVRSGDPYRAEIAFTDDAVGRLLATLEKRRHRELRVVVTSDHGEGLYDHGESTHGALLHATTIRVPIVAHTGDYAPELMPQPLSVERIPATMLVLLGLDPALNRHGAPPLTAPAVAVHAETLYPYFNFGWSGLRSREEDGWRLVTGPSDRLFRMEDDPGEVRNLAGDHPEIVARMKADLEDEWAQRNERAFQPAVRELSADEIDALRTLGYLAGGDRDPDADLARAFASGADPHAHLATIDRINQGLTALRYGKPDEAVALLRRVVEADPSNRFALEHLGRAQRDAGHPVDARETLRRALALGPNPELVYLDLAEIESEIGDRAAEEKALTQALATNPRSVEARTRLAHILIREGELEPALVLLDEALAIRPRATRVHLSIAQVYESLGRNEEAAAHWRRLLELDPGGKFGEVARGKLGG